MTKKKQIRRPPRFTAKKTAATPGKDGFERIDLKPISAQFDAVLEHLELIEPVAIDKEGVRSKIERLEDLQKQLAAECPQFWFMPFAIRTDPYK